MPSPIDCLLIGHNDTDPIENEELIARMGNRSGASRSLNLDYFRYEGRPYLAADAFRLMIQGRAPAEWDEDLVRLDDVFHAAIAYLGSYLHRHGFRFDYVNAFQEEKQTLVEKLTHSDILAVAITTTFYISPHPVLEIIATIRQNSPRTRIIIGGPYIATQVRRLPPHELRSLLEEVLGADIYVISSQGEATLVKVLAALKEGRSLDGIANLYYREAGGYHHTGIVAENNLLNDNPVDWSLFGDRVGEFVNIRTSISCPFGCKFCGFPEFAGTYRPASVDTLERELDGLRNTGKVDFITFIDDTLNVPPKRFKSILNMLIHKGFGFKWHSHYRCQYADVETVAMMKESGCDSVFLGIESGDDGMLRNMNKNATTAQFLRGIELLKNAGIVTYGSFIVGFPGETPETAQATMDFIQRSGLDFFRIYLWYGDTLTPIYQEQATYGLEGSRFEWRHATMDSETACDLIDEVFLAIDESVWLPHFNFTFDNLSKFRGMGFSLHQFKHLLTTYNQGIREKLSRPDLSEASPTVMQAIHNAAQRTHLSQVQLCT